MTALPYMLVLAATPVPVIAPCTVRLVPSDASRAWAAAVVALQNELQGPEMSNRDCREVVVRVASDGAPAAAGSVEVTTKDGRRGVRQVADAGDLEPTVEALITTVQIDDVGKPDVAAEASRAAPSAPPSTTWRLLLFAGGGGRLRLPSAPMPLVEMMAGAIHGYWELAAFGSWARTLPGGAAAAKAGFSSAAEVGLSLGQRRKVRGAEVIAGGRASAVGLWGLAEADTGVMSGSTSDNSGDTLASMTVAPAVAAFVATSFSLFASIRLRSQLSLQWIPLGLSTAESPSASSMWSVGLGVGAESRVP